MWGFTTDFLFSKPLSGDLFYLLLGGFNENHSHNNRRQQFVTLHRMKLGCEGIATAKLRSVSLRDQKTRNSFYFQTIVEAFPSMNLEGGN
jgi:hypothetical protein